MEKKINDYVNYMFNLNNIKDEEMFNEITSNLHERFAEYIEEGLSDDEAYLKTVGTLGDFDFKEGELDDKYAYKPNWANISLMISLALAILGTIALLLNQTMSMVFTGISISLYIGSAYYLYHLSKYVLKEEKNVKKHNNLLKSMFVNLKTSFIFWNINISYWLTTVVMGLIALIKGFSITIEDIYTLEPADIFNYIATIVIIFIAIFIVIFFIFILIYKKLEKTYLMMTNEEKLEGYLNKGFFNEYKPIIFAALTFVYITFYFLVMMRTGLMVFKDDGFRFVFYNDYTVADYGIFGVPAALIVLFSFVDIFLQGKVKEIIKIAAIFLLDIISLIVSYIELSTNFARPLNLIEINNGRIVATVITFLLIIFLGIRLLINKKQTNETIEIE